MGPYEVLSRLGAGGMGEVFLGLDTRLQRRVALKRLTLPTAAPADAVARAFREARAAARLNHPRIAAVYDVVEAASGTFIVMEYVDGESLANRLRRGPLPPGEVRAVLGQLASALAAAHMHGVVHRDLKPANIHLTASGSIKVLDFGIAKLAPPIADASADTTDQAVPDHTVGGTPGTPVYMSPEQLFGLDVDGRSDVYSAGIIGFEMATGRRPYLETNAAALAFAIKTTAPPSALSLDPSLPADLSDTLAKAIACDPHRRFQTAHELEQALAGSPAAAGTPADRRRGPPPRWIVATAAGALALMVAAGAASGWRGFRAAKRPARPAILAILPIENPEGDPQSEYLSAGIAAVAAQNLGAIDGFHVLPRSATAGYGATRRDAAAIGRDLAADYVLDLTLHTGVPKPQLVARLSKPDTPAPVWTETFEGEPAGMERALLESLGHAVERLPGRGRLSAAEWSRLRRLPTSSGEALAAYSEARALIDRPTVSGNLLRAAAGLRRALDRDPGFALAWAALGDCYLEQYRISRDPALAGRATDAVMRALGAGGGDASSYYSLGNVQYATGRSQDAVASLRRSLDLQPDNDDAHALLGRILAERGDTDGGAAEVTLAIGLRSRYWRHYMTLGTALYRGGHFREALDAYRRASELQQNDPEPYSGLGLIYQVLDDLPQAIGNYEHAVRLGPSATAYSNLGVVYYKAARYEDAIEAWNHALAIAPKSVLYYRNIGDAYRRLRRPGKAAAAYASAIAIGGELLAVNPQDVDTIALVAVCEAKVGRREAAVRHAAEAVALAPGSRVALQRSAEVHALVGDRAAALRDLDAAIQHGYARGVARTNDEFESLRTDPAFLALVAGAPVTSSRRAER